MGEAFSCEANVIKKDNNYKIEYYLVTEDELNFGIKSIMYENSSLISTNLFDLDLSKVGAEQMINMFCINYVFPQSYFDILSDMTFDNVVKDGITKNNVVQFPAPTQF